MYFDNENYLHVAQVYGRTISKINVDSGEIVEKFSYSEPNNRVMFPDDLVFGPAGRCTTQILRITRQCS